MQNEKNKKKCSNFTNRRDFVKMMASFGASAAIAQIYGCKQLTKSRIQISKKDDCGKYNVLFISVDDLHDWVSPLNNQHRPITPNFERLAKRGMTFTESYCPSPLCGPSRAAVLTGMRASTTGLYQNTDEFSELLSDAENLPLCFRRNGYKAMGAGKIFHGYFPQYWDESLENGARLYQAGQPKKNGTDLPGIFDWGQLDCDDSDMDDYKMASWTIDRLKRDYGSTPFFLACGLYLPHVPWYAPKKYFDMYPLDKIVMPIIKDNDIDDIPAIGKKIAQKEYYDAVEATGKSREAVQALMASITFADAQIGRILDALESSPYNDNTIVVVWGDNGVHQGQKQHWHKNTLWRESTRTPLFISVPNKTKPGAKCDQIVSPFDLYPTLAELCGIKEPEVVEGHSIVPLLTNPDLKWSYPAIMNRKKGEFAIRFDNWRYIRYANGSEELYDVAADPHEWNNLANVQKYSSVKTELAKFIPATVK
ncbi:MAG: hypothetical protein A2Y10_03650 [Planctomycetes bacterium GWF2_41_51]|nr:MAG: hypothetical protein A2Y10_03650 [Planctomycetes bacterium GWF2_41_51]HBG28838.1 iduronate-2-sulfatase [Phycisphaerales bacterium]